MSQPLGKAYFRDQLRRDPSVDSATILGIRAAALRIDSQASSQTRTFRSPELVQQTRATIQTIRSEFWTLEPADLESRLQSINVELFPELEVAIERMMVASKARDDFALLTARLKKNVSLVNYLAKSVTASPREIGGLKEIVAREMLTSKGRKHKSASRLIRREFPRVYAIDSMWLDGLVNGSVPGKSWFVIPGLSRVPFWVWWVLAISLIRILVVVSK